MYLPAISHNLLVNYSEPHCIFLRKQIMEEMTFVMIKPDAVQRGLSGQIISRFEARGLTLAGLKLKLPSKELAAQHYEHLVI